MLKRLRIYGEEKNQIDRTVINVDIAFADFWTEQVDNDNIARDEVKSIRFLMVLFLFMS